MKKIFQFIKTATSHLIRYFFDLVFFVLLPLVFLYSWLRFGLKKLFHLQPNVNVSPMGEPLPFNNVKALRAAGFRADNVAYICPRYFRSISFGLILEDNFYLRMLTYLTDYTFLFLWAVFKYDFFEFAFIGGILKNSHLRKLELPLLKILAKKISVYGYGADCKVLSDIKKMGFKYHTAMDRNETTERQPEKEIAENVARAKKYADVLIAGGDLIHLGKKAIFLPIPADLSLWPSSPPKNHKKIVLIHSTNHRLHKGTRFIIKIVGELEKRLPIRLMLLERKTLEECQRLYPLGDIMITDVITGWHGYTAIEAMATGRPDITYLRPDIMKFHSYYAKGRIPVVSANPDHLAGVLERLVKDEKLREDLGRQGIEYAHKFHSLEFVGSLRRIIFESIWDGKKINQKIFEREVKKRGLIG